VQRFLAASVIILLGLGLAAAVAQRPKHGPGPSAKTHTVLVVPPGQTVVSGTVTEARLDPADHPALPLPLTLTVAQRGVGGGTIDDAVVNGERETIVWDGGTPLVLQGTGALDVAPAAVDVSAAGLRWLLDAHPNVFGAGRYAVVGPVAAGAHGLASPHDRVDFAGAAGPPTGLLTNGGVTVMEPLAAQPVQLTGPGRVHLVGDLTLQQHGGRTHVTAADFGDGPFQLTFALAGGRVVVSGVVQGAQAG